MDIGECFVCNSSTSLEHCTECQIDCCEECYECHSKSCYDLKSKQYHICEVHKIQVKRYCIDCDNLLCEKCLGIGHSGHNVSLLIDAFDTLKRRAETIFQDLKQRKGEVQKIVGLIDTIRAEDEEGKSEGIASTMVQEKRNIKEYSKPLLDILQDINLHVKYLETKDCFVIVFLWKWIELKKRIKIYDTQESLFKDYISKYSQQLEVQLKNALQPFLTRGCVLSLTTDQAGLITHRCALSVVDIKDTNGDQCKMADTNVVTTIGFDAHDSNFPPDIPTVRGTKSDLTHVYLRHGVKTDGVHYRRATIGCQPKDNVSQNMNCLKSKMTLEHDHEDSYVVVPNCNQTNSSTETNQASFWMEEEGGNLYSVKYDGIDSVADVTRLLSSFTIADKSDVKMKECEGSSNAFSKTMENECVTRMCKSCTILKNDLDVKTMESQKLKEYFIHISNLCYQMVEKLNNSDEGYLTFTRTNHREFDKMVEQLEMIFNTYIKKNNELVVAKKELNDTITRYADWTTEQFESEKANSNAQQKQIQDMETKFNQIHEQNKILSSRATELQTDLDHSKKQCDRLRQENHEIQKKQRETTSSLNYMGKLQKELAELKDYKHHHDRENESLKEHIHQLQFNLSQRVNDCQLLSNDRNSLQLRLTAMQKYIEQQNREHESMKGQVNSVQLQLSRKETDFQVLTKEKDSLQLRLSTLAGNQLTKGNPAITDLSDSNRPMKIGEQYTELYDNEWTDAIECTETITSLFPDFKQSEIEEIVIRHIYKITTDCYKECLVISEGYVHNIEQAINAMVDVHCDGEQKRIDAGDVPVLKEILQLRKQNAAKFAEGLFKNKVIKTKIDLDDWEFDHKNEDLLNLLMETPFFEKCIQLCWYMVIQDPVMYLDVELITGTKYDKNLYRECTCSGDKVRFTVWPALFLHKTGPVLSKGVVQACS